MNINQEIFEGLIEQVENIIGDRKLTITNVVGIVGMLIQLVERQHQLAGPDKKQLVIDLLSAVMNRNKSFSKDDKEQIMLVIEQFVPPAIDLIISATKGQLLINLKESGCLPCFKKEKSVSKNIKF